MRLPLPSRKPSFLPENSRQSNLELRGLMGYEGHAVFIKDIEEKAEPGALKLTIYWSSAKEALEDAGFEVSISQVLQVRKPMISPAETPASRGEPGSYIFMDTRYGGIEGINLEQSLFVLTAVISKKGPSEAILDAGKKAVTRRVRPARVADAPTEAAKLAEEHTALSRPHSPACELRVGDKSAADT